MKMNNIGKASTIILVVVAVLFLSLFIISIYLYQQETEMRKSAEAQLAQSKAAEAKLDADLKDAKNKVALLEEKAKEADKKINDLEDELELEVGIKDQLKVENAALKEALTSENTGKETLQNELTAAQEKAAALEGKLQAEEKLRADLEAKVKEMEQAGQSEVQLERIVVTPGQIPDGKVVSINKENNFVIINLGQEHGITQDMIMSVNRGNKYLGDIKITRAQDGMSAADFVAPLTSKQVKKDDKITVKK